MAELVAEINGQRHRLDRLELYGHRNTTEEAGLETKRAEVVKQWLVKRGIPEAVLVVSDNTGTDGSEVRFAATECEGKRDRRGLGWLPVVL